MGFLSKDTNEIQPEPQTPINLPEEISDLLLLNNEAIESYNKGILEKGATDSGKNYYVELSKDPTYSSQQMVELGEIRLQGKAGDKSDLVTNLYTQMKQVEADMQSLSPEQQKNIKTHLVAFSEGYAQAAIEANDWQTAIKSYNETTEGGIIQKPEVIKTLGEKFRDNEPVRLEMATLIQTLINEKSQSSQPSHPDIESQPDVQENKVKKTYVPTQIEGEPYKPAIVTYVDAPQDKIENREPRPTPTESSTQIQNETPEPRIPLASSRPTETITASGQVLRPVPPPSNQGN